MPSAPLAAGRNPILYAYEGSAEIGPDGKTRPLPYRAAGVLSYGDSPRINAGIDGACFLLLAARPLHESMVQYRPFVMNTREEVEQALAHYRDGKLTQFAALKSRKNLP